MIFQPEYSSSGSLVAGASPSSSGCQAGTHAGQDALLSQGHPHTPTLRLKHWRRVTLPRIHICVMWEDPEGPEKTHADMRTRQPKKDSEPPGN